MAIYKTVKGVSKHLSGLKTVLSYVGKANKEERVFKTTGLHISNNPVQAFYDMIMTKEIYRKKSGRQYRHHIQSFKKGEGDPETIHKLGVEFCQAVFPDFDVYIATHIDKDHIHNHFIINTVSNTTGRKINEITKKQYEEKKGLLAEHEYFLQELKDVSDAFCQKYHFTVIDKTKKPASLNIYNQSEYHALQKHMKGQEINYKVDLALKIKDFATRSKSRQEFIDLLRLHNISTTWTEKKKHVTFEFIHKGKKKKIRLARLYESFEKDTIFTKEGLENEFKQYNQRNERTQSDTSKRRDKSPTNDTGEPFRRIDWQDSGNEFSGGSNSVKTSGKNRENRKDDRGHQQNSGNEDSASRKRFTEKSQGFTR